MKNLFCFILLCLSLVACSGGGGGSSSSTSTNATTVSLSDNFDASHATFWTVSNPNGVTLQYSSNSNSTRSVKLTGGVSSAVTFTGLTHLTASRFDVTANLGFDDEQKLENAYEIIFDYGSGDKIVATFYISAVNNYVSPRHASNDTQASFFYRIYKNNVLQLTSSTQAYGAIQNDWDSEHSFMQQYSISRINGNMTLDVTGNGGSVSMSVAEATYSFGSDVAISVKAYSTGSASMAMTMDNFSLSGSVAGYR